MSRLHSLAAAAAHLLAAALPSSLRAEVLSKAADKVRHTVLHQAAEKLDAQADAHGQAIHDYADLLRVWATDPQRWEAGQ